jgi:hypothetical protein
MGLVILYAPFPGAGFAARWATKITPLRGWFVQAIPGSIGNRFEVPSVTTYLWSPIPVLTLRQQLFTYVNWMMNLKSR